MSTITPTPEGPNQPPEVLQTRGQARVSTASDPGTGRTLAYGVGGLAVLLLLGFIVAFAVRAHHENVARRLAQENIAARPVVAVVSVRSAAKDYPIELPGETTGWYQSIIFSRVDGYVASWVADIGDRVKQGQVLATIDTPEMDQELIAARAQAAASAAKVAVAESNVSIARLTYERWRDSPRGVVSEQEREEKKASYQEATAQLAAAKAQNQLDAAYVAKFVAMEVFKKVTAPYYGIITARHLDVGDLVSSGSSANNNSLYAIAQSNVIRVFVDVPQKAAADMVAGLGAMVTCDQYLNRVFRGKLARSAMSIDPQTRTQRTEVDIPNPDLALVPGMYVQVTFQVAQTGSQEVPAAAILFRSTGLQVAVVDGEDRIDFRPVMVAKDNGDTLVLENGVKAGERVALNLSSAIVAGELVTPVEGETPAKFPVSGANKIGNRTPSAVPSAD